MQILFPYIQHIPHFGSREDKCLQLARCNCYLSRDPLPELGDELALVVGYLPLVRFVTAVIAHLARPEPVVEFLSGDDFLRPFR